MRRTFLILLLLASMLACERREAPIVTPQEVQEPPQLAAKPLTVDEAVATATHYAAIFLGEGIKPAGVTPIFSRRTRGDNGARDTMLLAVHMAGGGLTFVDPRLAPQDAVLCVLPDTDAVDSLPPPAQFLIEAICAKLPGQFIDPNGEGPIDWSPPPPPSTGGGGGGGGSSGPPDGAHFPPNGDVMPIDGYSPPENDYTVTTSTENYYGPWLKTTWNQDDGFNKNCIVNGVTCKAGCVPVAIAQLLAYYRLPPNIPWDGVLEDSIPRGVYMDPVADLLFRIGKKACADYGKDATSVSTYKIAPTLRAFGLSAKSVGDRSEKALRELGGSRPVLVTGFTREDSESGHAWVLDGVYVKRTCKDRYNSNGYLLDTECTSRYMVHANMGWGGKGNGWYYITDYKVPYNGHYTHKFTFFTGIQQ